MKKVILLCLFLICFFVTASALGGTCWASDESSEYKAM